MISGESIVSSVGIGSDEKVKSKKFDLEVMRKSRMEVLGTFEEFINEIQSSLKNSQITKWGLEADYHSYRASVHEKAMELAKKGFIKTRWLRDDPLRFLAALCSIATPELSVPAKLVIHFQLCGGTILELGTKYHHDKFLDDIDSMKHIGGFAMTEMGFGSNVREIETQATYDKSTQEFIIHTPSTSATKFWIGNMAVYGTLAVVFAQLEIEGIQRGVHAFVVPIRDPITKQLFPNIEVGDCGLKVGWNGIDNAWIRFTQVRIPRCHLLNRFSDVLPNGTFITSASSPDKLFQKTLSQLMVGRLLYITGPVHALNLGLRISIRYAFARRQFGSQQVINYSSHKYALMPMLAFTLGLEFTRNQLMQMLGDAMRENRDHYHSIVSGVKALVCEFCVESLGKMRVLCGGNGFSAYNWIGPLRNDMDVFQTAEGDGTVLHQQQAKYLLKQFKKSISSFSGYMSFFGHQTWANLLEMNPVTYRTTSKAHLLDANFQEQAFSFRFVTLLTLTGSKFARLKKQMDAFTAWSNTVNEAVQLSKAHSHLFILQQFNRGISQCSDPAVINVLTLARNLYALSNIESDFGFFRNYEYMNSAKAMAISELVMELCNEMKDHALDLIDSTPFMCDWLVSAPIAAKDGNYMEQMLASVKQCTPYAKL